MRLVVDVNLSPRWISRLRSAGFEATHWSELGDNDAPDTAIIAFARSTNAIILTRDLDFGAHMVLTGAAKPSIIQLRAEIVSPDQIGHMLIEIIRRLESDLEQGAIVTIDPKRTRITLLPF